MRPGPKKGFHGCTAGLNSLVIPIAPLEVRLWHKGGIQRTRMKQNGDILFGTTSETDEKLMHVDELAARTFSDIWLEHIAGTWAQR
jgi:hypothetical protein